MNKTVLLPPETEIYRIIVISWTSQNRKHDRAMDTHKFNLFFVTIVPGEHPFHLFNFSTNVAGPGGVENSWGQGKTGRRTESTRNPTLTSAAKRKRDTLHFTAVQLLTV